MVNLASRMVNIARPGSVLVSTSIHETLDGNPAFSLKPLRARYLQGIGRTPLWALMHAGADEAEKDADKPEERKTRGRRRDRRPGVLLPLPDPMRKRMELRRPSGSNASSPAPPTTTSAMRMGAPKDRADAVRPRLSGCTARSDRRVLEHAAFARPPVPGLVVCGGDCGAARPGLGRARSWLPRSGGPPR